uniref:Ion transport domain-containing protein n=1 Tax=Ditylum brightwellii TaxID=49249 RepID=A0A7S1ZZQ5_9STRA|mmetsp:Transcript_5512/g.8379  ORF Transcript_5512/g.8379 Transcript_5512/m.8379 type:complete len:783 (+) Transcript_5512:288-2636(+)
MNETQAPDNDHPLQAEEYLTDSVGGEDSFQADIAYPLQESLTLHTLCDIASKGDEDSWEKVRQWLSNHDLREIEEEAQKLGDCNTTALHQSCRNCPPLDVIETFLKDAPQIVRWSDFFGWLPLHCACANSASEDVLRVLADAYPESKTATDRRGRTPLHFALGSTDIPVTAAAVVLLSSTGAASCPDENGMLPLHYACAYGAPEEALHVLTDNNADSIVQTDRNGRTPLHFALGNADRQASPNVVRLLLYQNPDVVNITDKEKADLPLHLLATRAKTLNEMQTSERENATKCLDLYLNANPHPTASFLAALQSLPEWLRDHAVVTPPVKNILNEKISQRFPTAILMLDIIMLLGVFIVSCHAVSESITLRHDAENEGIPSKILSVLYIGAIYFTIWEILQMLSLHSLGLFNTWLSSSENYIDVVFILIILATTIVMNTGAMELDDFRIFASVSFIVIIGNVVYFLRSIQIDFAIFINALYHIILQLITFIVVLLIFLLAFSLIFFTLFVGNDDLCPDNVFCTFQSSFITSITMFLGEVDQNHFLVGREDKMKYDPVSTAFFAIFFFLVVILLATFLIAIVTDAYGVIKDERAEIVFWSNRLDFVAEVDAILSGPWKKKTGLCGNSMHHKGKKFDKLRNLWKILTDLLEDVPDDSAGFISLQVLCVTFTKVVTVMIMILWILIGFVTFGFLWPPQVREKIFKQRVAKGSNDVKEHEQRVMEIKELSKEVSDLENEIVAGMSTNWANIIAMERQLTEMREEMTTEINHIKQIMTMLFDLQAGGI